MKLTDSTKQLGTGQPIATTKARLYQLGRSRPPALPRTKVSMIAQ